MTFEDLYSQIEQESKSHIKAPEGRIYIGFGRFFDIKTEKKYLSKRAEWQKAIQQSFKPTGNKERDINILENLLIKLVVEEQEKKKGPYDHHIAKHLLDEFKEGISHS